MPYDFDYARFRDLLAKVQDLRQEIQAAQDELSAHFECALNELSLEDALRLKLVRLNFTTTPGFAASLKQRWE